MACCVIGRYCVCHSLVVDIMSLVGIVSLVVDIFHHQCCFWCTSLIPSVGRTLSVEAATHHKCALHIGITNPSIGVHTHTTHTPQHSCSGLWCPVCQNSLTSTHVPLMHIVLTHTNTCAHTHTHMHSNLRFTVPYLLKSPPSTNAPPMHTTQLASCSRN